MVGPSLLVGQGILWLSLIHLYSSSRVRVDRWSVGQLVGSLRILGNDLKIWSGGGFEPESSKAQLVV